MDLIAIIGKPGSGKTTISKYLTELYPNINYLNIDELSNNNPNLFQLRLLGLNDINNNIIMGKNERTYYNGLKKEIIKWIDIETKKGTLYGIVDFATLHMIPDIWSLFKYKILLIKDDDSRKKLLALRAGEQRAEKLNVYGEYAFKEFNYDVDFKIINDDSIDVLYKKAENVFKQIIKETT